MTRHPTLWIDDGNIVLVVENTGFRVHRSTLARHSGFFHTMFSLPQPAATPEELIEGCHVVPIPDEDLEAITIVLGVLYLEDTYQCFYCGKPSLRFPTIIKILAVATKFQFDAIRNEALRRLDKLFPSSLHGLRRLVDHCLSSRSGASDDEQNANKNEHEEIGGDNGYLYDNDPGLALDDAITMVSIAQQFDLPSLLPTALYICAQLPANRLFDAIKDTSTRLRHFSANHFALCMQFRLQLQRFSHDFTTNLVEGWVYERCLKRCRRAHADLIRGVYLQGYMRPVSHCLQSVETVIKGCLPDAQPQSVQPAETCGSCVVNLIQEIEETQQSAWKKLRGTYGSTS